MNILLLHPGHIIRHEYLLQRDLSEGQAAEMLGLEFLRFHKVLTGRAEVTAGLAIRLEKLFGTSAEEWLRLQAVYDLAIARTGEAEIVATMKLPRKSAAAPGR